MFYKSLKTFSCLSARLSRLGSVSRFSANKPLSLYHGSTDRLQCKSELSVEKDTNNVKKMYPTHYVTCRGFSSGTVTLKNNKPGKESNANPFKFHVTLEYSFQYIFARMRDWVVQYHVNRSFIDGARERFIFVSRCIHNRDYEEIREMVTPDVLQKIMCKDVYSKDKIAHEELPEVLQKLWYQVQNINPKDGRVYEDLFLVQDAFVVSLRGLKLDINKETKIKTLEVKVRFSYFTRESQEDKVVNFATYTFVRTYGEEMKDSHWIITDMSYK